MKKIFQSSVIILAMMSVLFSYGGVLEAATLVPPKRIDDSQITLPGKTIATVSIPINAPGNLVAESSEVGKLVLHWTDNSSNESGFKIERKSGSDDSFFEIDYVSANTTSYEQSELSTYAVFPGETYCYRVKAFNASNSSSYSNEASITVMAEVASPSAPAALRAKAMMADGQFVVRLFWGDTANNEQKYVVQRSKAAEGFVVVGELPANSFKFEEHAMYMERNVKFTYRVIAYNAGGAGVSNTAEIVLPANTPSIPSFNWPQAQGSSSLLLTWHDNSDNEDGFKIIRYGDQPTNPFWGTKPADQEYMISPGETSLLVTGLRPYTLYSFELIAYNALGHNGYSQTQSYTGPPAPTSLMVESVSPTENKLTWASINNYAGFSVERKKAGGIYSELVSLGLEARNYSDPLAMPGTQYFYRVRSWAQSPYDGSKNWSDYSNEMGITTSGQSTSNIISGVGGTSNLPIVRKIIKLKLGERDYEVDGQTLQMDTVPISQEGRTLLPIRYLTEPLGANLEWDDAAQKVTIVLKERKIELWIGKNTALVNGKAVMIDPANPAVLPVTVPPGRILLPARFVSENLGCQVQWDALTQTASVSLGGN